LGEERCESPPLFCLEIWAYISLWTTCHLFLSSDISKSSNVFLWGCTKKQHKRELRTKELFHSAKTCRLGNVGGPLMDSSHITNKKKRVVRYDTKKEEIYPSHASCRNSCSFESKNLKITSSSLRDGHLCRDGQVQRGQLAWLSGSFS